MSATVHLEVTAGPWRGKAFRFDEHDTFVFGRAPDCHIPMPADDKSVSRHHFLLEANPPDAVLSLAQAAPILRQSLEGLAHAHAKGFVHRDLKPHNLLLAGREGNWTAKIGDFGMAKSFEQAGLSGMTVTGNVAAHRPNAARTGHQLPASEACHRRVESGRDLLLHVDGAVAA